MSLSLKAETLEVWLTYLSVWDFNSLQFADKSFGVILWRIFGIYMKNI